MDGLKVFHIATLEKVELNIVALTKSESQPGSFALILEDVKESRRLPITVGQTEAQAIAVVLEKMQPSRPQTHDLLRNVLKGLGAELVEVVISQIVDDKYHSLLMLKLDQETISVDTRTSDAIALAVRCECPIYAYEDILKKAAFSLDDVSVTSQRRGSFFNYPLKELEELLQRVLAKEDYESATRIRDAISKKKSMNQ